MENYFSVTRFFIVLFVWNPHIHEPVKHLALFFFNVFFLMYVNNV